MLESPRLRALAPLALAAATLAVYAPSLQGGFVWDDDTNLSENAALLGPGALARIWGGTMGLPYYPLTHSSLWLQLRTTGLATWPYHLVNVALHATTAILLLFILRRLGLRGATFAAFLFALHPLNVESVAWIIERKNVLSGALGLGAMLVYLRFDEDRGAPSRTKAVLWSVAFALYLLALLAKTTVSMLPFALAVVLGLRRAARAARTPESWTTRVGIADLLPLVPFFAAGLVAGAFTAFFEKTRLGAGGADFGWSVPFRVLLAGRIFLFYLAKIAAPLGSMFFYPKWTVDTGSGVAWLFPLGVVAAFIAAIRARRRGTTGPLVALLVYGVLLSPALGFFNVYFMRFAYVQDHFAYLATMPALAFVAASVAPLVDLWPRAGRAAMTAILVALGALSVRESLAFHDYDTLFQGALAKNPAAWVASYNLGYRALQAGRPADAARYLRMAFEVRPEDPDIAANLGTALARTGHIDEALPFYEAATHLRPDDADILLNHAAGLALAGRTEEAIAQYRRAIAARPKWPRPERELAWLLATTDDARVRDGAAAVPLAESACGKTTKALARCLDTLAAAYAASGDFEQAMAKERDAIAGAGVEGRAGDMPSYEARARMYQAREAYVAKRGGE